MVIFDTDVSILVLFDGRRHGKRKSNRLDLIKTVRMSALKSKRENRIRCEVIYPKRGMKGFRRSTQFCDAVLVVTIPTENDAVVVCWANEVDHSDYPTHEMYAEDCLEGSGNFWSYYYHEQKEATHLIASECANGLVRYIPDLDGYEDIPPSIARDLLIDIGEENLCPFGKALIRLMNEFDKHCVHDMIHKKDSVK